MPTTVELPDELTAAGEELRRLREPISDKNKVRRMPPVVGSPDSPPVGILTAEQIDEAMFG